MPELPDVTVYRERLAALVVGHELQDVRLGSPFLLRTVEPAPAALCGRPVREVERIGKRLVLAFDDELFLVLHLMIAGRLRWKPRGFALTGKAALAGFDFAPGTLVLTEQGSKKRASLHVVRGRGELAQFDRGGLSVFACDDATTRRSRRRCSARTGRSSAR